jgi:hypothetical protein
MALDLFRRALRAGYRQFDAITRDPDLKPILAEQEFRDALAAARTLMN